MKIVELKALAKERGSRDYSKLKKAELIAFLQNNLRPTPAPRTRPPPQMSTWEPIDDRPKTKTSSTTNTRSETSSETNTCS